MIKGYVTKIRRPGQCYACRTRGPWVGGRWGGDVYMAEHFATWQEAMEWANRETEV